MKRARSQAVIMLSGVLTLWGCAVDLANGTAEIWDAEPRWEVLQVPTDEDLVTLSFVDHKTGWVAGKRGSILRTTDGGSSWQVLRKGWEKEYRDWKVTIRFSDIDEGELRGDKSSIVNPSDTIDWTTYDGGVTWKERNTVVRRFEKEITLATGETWQGSDPPNRFHSSLGGLSPLNALGISLGFYEWFFVDNQTGWILGAHLLKPGAIDYVLFETKDSGRAWQRIATFPIRVSEPFSTPIGNRHPHHPWFASQSRGWLLIGNVILTTKDGGHTWVEEFRSDRVIRESQFVVDGVAYACGAGGLMLRRQPR